MHYLQCIIFGEFFQGGSKYLEIKALETMVETTQFDMELPTIHTSITEEKITLASYYHLTHDNARREIVPCQRYIMLGFSVML